MPIKDPSLDYDAPRELIDGWLKANDRDMQWLSLEIGYAKTFIRDYLKKEKPQQLTEPARLGLAKVLGGPPDRFLPSRKVYGTVNDKTEAHELSYENGGKSPPEGRETMIEQGMLLSHESRLNDIEKRLNALEIAAARQGVDGTTPANPQKRGRR